MQSSFQMIEKALFKGNLSPDTVNRLMMDYAKQEINKYLSKLEQYDVPIPKSEDGELLFDINLT